MDCFRLLETSGLPAVANISLDEALLEAHSIGQSPDTIRFLSYSPHAVLVGLHQAVEQEIRLDYCKEQHIDINRRITGGGAIYFDESQIGWEIIASSERFTQDIEELYRLMCEPVVEGLNILGIDAGFRGKNDIEVGGRKISGTGGTRRKDSFLFQGTLLVDFDIVKMIKALRIPVKKLKDKELASARERVTCIRDELGYTPERHKIHDALAKGFEKTWGIRLERGPLTAIEEKAMGENIKRFSSDGWIYEERSYNAKQNHLSSLKKAPGGLVRATLVVRSNTIQSALITGDFFAFPYRAIFDLEAQLKGVKAEKKDISRVVGEFFKRENPKIPGVTAKDMIHVINEALDKRQLIELGLSPDESCDIFTVGGDFKTLIKSDPRLVLIPYCAKKTDCDFRRQEGCNMCGGCNASDVYKMSRDRGLETVGICNFEHLIKILNKAYSSGQRTYVGLCCEAFYTKHQDEMEETGMSGILIDIGGTTCYDLGLENQAYLGEYTTQTELDTDLFQKIMDLMGSGKS